eukprot:10276067-Karenia_brevis.AAC.1
MVEFPEEFASLLATLFGNFKWDKPVLTQEGTLTPDASPWARQFFKDMHAVRHLVPGAATMFTSFHGLWQDR